MVKPSPPSLRLAAAQFPVSANLTRNQGYITRLSREAAAAGAQVVLFPEGALSGYAPTHHHSLDNFPWAALEKLEVEIAALARELEIWIAFGSMRRDKRDHARLCLNACSNLGRTIACYDKRSLYGREKELFTPGHSPCVVNIHGHDVGLLICYDNCFPDLYREYQQMGVSLILQAFHNAGNEGATDIAALIEASLIIRAADHGMSICASNSSRPYSPLPASIVHRDGSSVRAARHVSGIVLDDFPKRSLGWIYPEASDARSRR